VTLRLFFAVFILTCISCETPSAPVNAEPAADKAAKALCSCTEALLAENANAQASLDSMAFVNLARAFEDAKKCSLGIQMDQTTRGQLPAALQTHCPKLAAHADLVEELLSVNY
jgi:hypothetical protein